MLPRIVGDLVFKVSRVFIGCLGGLEFLRSYGVSLGIGGFVRFLLHFGLSKQFYSGGMSWLIISPETARFYVQK